MVMEYEFDFLPVGEGEKSGDAICLRYSDDGCQTWTVGVIDGGSRDSGQKLVEHVLNYYQTDTIDFIVCTHPDKDHASGLSIVLDKLTVKRVLVHCPWDYIDYIWDAVNDGRVTKDTLKNKLIEKHPYAYAVYQKAKESNIPIYHPFSDHDDHGIPYLNVVGPSSSFYLKQLINFRSITHLTDDELEKASMFTETLKGLKGIIKMIAEGWDDEHLVNPKADSTSSENLSSAICFFNFGGKKVLLTGDAGVDSLEAAADHIESLGHDLCDFSLFQIPHHGSKRNIGPDILNRLVGSPKLFGTSTHFTAMVSAAKDNDKHPSKRVTNALRRRGGKVIATMGQTKHHFTSGMPKRDGWSNVDPLPFYQQVEDDD